MKLKNKQTKATKTNQKNLASKNPDVFGGNLQRKMYTKVKTTKSKDFVSFIRPCAMIQVAAKWSFLLKITFLQVLMQDAHPGHTLPSPVTGTISD